MVQIIVIVISFVLTILIGGKIAQDRQQDSWIAQQRFSGEEKEYLELKKLCDEIASSLGVRIYAMRRLALQLIARARNSTFDESAVADYKESVKLWNQNLNSYYVRLSQLDLASFRYELESNLHDPMRKEGAKIDICLNRGDEQTNKRELGSVIKNMERVNLSALDFNKSLLKRVHRLRRRIYFPERVLFSRDTMHKFSTWMLIKAIFIVDINRITIIRSPLDS